MSLEVLNPGLASTIQDLGRPGYRGYGVPEGGAFDRTAFRLANALLGNTSNCAAIEITMVGGHFRASHPLALSIAGAPFNATIRRGTRTDPIRCPQTFTLQADDELVISGTPVGLRAYIAVKGGWQTPTILESRSTETRLIAGDTLVASRTTTSIRRPNFASFIPPAHEPFRLLDGPDGPVPLGLLGRSYRVGQASDRVGIRLEGDRLEGLTIPDRLSCPLAPGAIQIADDLPLIVGVAGGTMGGYPHRAHIISADLDRLAQLRPGDTISFTRVELDLACKLDLESRKMLKNNDLWLRTSAL
jgi:allophanate hydrolase subunit 2